MTVCAALADRNRQTRAHPLTERGSSKTLRAGATALLAGSVPPTGGPAPDKKGIERLPSAVYMENPTCHKRKTVHYNCIDIQLPTAKLDTCIPCPYPGKGPRYDPVRRKNTVAAQRVPAEASAVHVRHVGDGLPGRPRSGFRQAQETLLHTVNPEYNPKYWR